MQVLGVSQSNLTEKKKNHEKIDQLLTRRCNFCLNIKHSGVNLRVKYYLGKFCQILKHGGGKLDGIKFK